MFPLEVCPTPANQAHPALKSPWESLPDVTSLPRSLLPQVEGLSCCYKNTFPETYGKMGHFRLLLFVSIVRDSPKEGNRICRSEWKSHGWQTEWEWVGREDCWCITRGHLGHGTVLLAWGASVPLLPGKDRYSFHCLRDFQGLLDWPSKS